MGLSKVYVTYRNHSLSAMQGGFRSVCSGYAKVDRTAKTVNHSIPVRRTVDETPDVV